jgi:hypothetical protein
VGDDTNVGDIVRRRSLLALAMMRRREEEEEIVVVLAFLTQHNLEQVDDMLCTQQCTRVLY